MCQQHAEMNRESTLNSTLTLWNLRAYYLVSNKYNQFVILEQFYVLQILLKDLNPRVVPSAPTELMWKSDQWRLLRPVKTDQSEQTALKETVANAERLRRRGNSSAAWGRIRELKNKLNNMSPFISQYENSNCFSFCIEACRHGKV